MRGLIKKGIDKYLNLKSFKTDFRYVIIESDDWGSIRTKDLKTKNELIKINSQSSTNSFTLLDSIASEEDLENLFDVLGSVKDKYYNPACLTANVCTANPDFLKIKKSNFNEYYYKPFTETLKEYSNNIDLFSIWQQGEKEKLFKPQLHGREHVHALEWLRELKFGNKELLRAFDLNTWGISYTSSFSQKRKNLQASLDSYHLNQENKYHKEWIAESASIFKSTFGYNSKSFIAPAYTWHTNLHKTMADSGIKTLQGIKLQYQPRNKSKTDYKRKPHYTGEIDKKSGLIYTTRNAFFEPHSAPDKDWIDICLTGVKNAFDNNLPAIIGSHRINFIGRLDEKHRDRNLKMLKEILKQIKIKYPNVQFIDSGQFADILTKNVNHN